MKCLYLQLRKKDVRLPVEFLPRKTDSCYAGTTRNCAGRSSGASQASSCQEVISMLSGMAVCAPLPTLADHPRGAGERGGSWPRSLAR